eukprot:TRINITY_DN15120_c0_g1_i1.p1 TRINITY_DN15120_c0_g1~~TRINITY_DN15120_c0_g1_i1.p1  ORF type:complete len:562 (+),score=79.66 TRINITY_DN15120_c0_g1_i1:157-1842(+)
MATWLTSRVSLRLHRISTSKKVPRSQLISISTISTIPVAQRHLVGANAMRRPYSTDNGSPKKKSSGPGSLQDALRKFYLKVHPDLFSQHPKQKEVNEKSFQALMAILDDFKGLDAGSAGRAKATTGKLTFYFRKSTSKPAQSKSDAVKADDKNNKDAATEEEEESMPEPSKEVAMDFGKAEVLLRAPDPSATLEQRERMLAGQLAELFSACGVPFDAGKAAFSLGKGQSWSDEVSLQHFLSKVSERCRELAQQRLQKEQQMDIERTMFYVQHKLRILTDFPDDIARDWKRRTETEKQLLNALESALKALAGTGFDMERLHNCVVVFGHRRGLDLLGRMNLHMEDSTTQWLEHLKTVDPVKIREIRDSGRARSETEKALATRLGLAYFYSDYSIASSFQYLLYIDSVLKAFDGDSSRKTFLDMKEIKLRITDQPALNDASEPNISVDVPSCTVLVPIGTDPASLFSFVSKAGAGLVRQHRHHVQVAEAQHQVILRIKRKYQLSSLLTDPSLRFEHVESCCRKLANHAPSIGNMLQGLRLFIGHEYDVKQGDGTVYIKWNWLL